jgi:6-phosphogluconolactonase
MKAPSEILSDRIVSIISLLDKDKKMNLAISGGNSPDKLFSLWSGSYLNIIDWERVNLFWVDERCVPPHHNDSNFGRAFDFFLSNAGIPDPNIFRINGEIDNEKAALEYEMTIKNVFDLSEGFDMVILGIGEDGHTSSVFPGQKDLYSSKRYYMPSVNPYTGQKRVALTLSGILKSKEIVFFLDGPSKISILKLIESYDHQEDILMDNLLPVSYVIEKAVKSYIYWENAPSVDRFNINSIFVI